MSMSRGDAKMGNLRAKPAYLVSVPFDIRVQTPYVAYFRIGDGEIPGIGREEDG